MEIADTLMLVHLNLGLELAGAEVAAFLGQIGIGLWKSVTFLQLFLDLWIFFAVMPILRGGILLYAMKLCMAVTPELQMRRCSLKHVSQHCLTKSKFSSTFFCLAAALVSAFLFFTLASASFPGFKRPSFSAAAAAWSAADRA